MDQEREPHVVEVSGLDFFLKNVLKLQFDVAGRALYFEDYELWSYEGQDLSRFFSGKMHPLQASCCHSFDPQELLNYLLVAEPDFKDGEHVTLLSLPATWHSLMSCKMLLQTLGVDFKDLQQQKYTNRIPIIFYIYIYIYIYANINIYL